MSIIHAIMDHEYHTPVLVREVLEYLITKRDGLYVDCTLGGGGHAEQILTSLTSRGKLIGFDRDVEAILYAQQRLATFASRITFIQDNFAQVREHLERHGIKKIHGLLLDLGVSSHQIDKKKRGFSFQADARLDMRMNQTQTLDAWTVINTYDEQQLADMFWRFGEERNSRRIAKAIVRERSRQSLDTTGILRKVISNIVGQKMLAKTLARIFQAIRIEVNKELEHLQKVLRDTIELLDTGGRVVVISYHSLEDRLVKEFFREESANIQRSRTPLVPDQTRWPRLHLLTKKPIKASADEIKNNPRARSAKLRAAERI